MHRSCDEFTRAAQLRHATAGSGLPAIEPQPGLLNAGTMA